MDIVLKPQIIRYLMTNVYFTAALRFVDVYSFKNANKSFFILKIIHSKNGIINYALKITLH
jgi:hypothetical protein